MRITGIVVGQTIDLTWGFLNPDRGVYHEIDRVQFGGKKHQPDFEGIGLLGAFLGDLREQIPEAFGNRAPWPIF